MKWGLIAPLAALCLAAGAPAWADVQVTLHDGRVTIVAKDATLRQIMTEWARVGQTKVVNIERIPGGPLTLELRDVTEDQALDILMRPLSGYLAAPRAAVMPNLSKFDRILVMPTLAAARQATTATSAPTAAAFPAPAPVFQPPQPNAPPESDANDGVPAENVGAPRAPVFTAFPAPQVVNPNQAGQQGAYIPPPGMTLPTTPGTPAAQAGPGSTPPAQAAPSPVPRAPVGVAVPGMMTPVPQAQPPGQTPTSPYPPGMIQAPVRRPGGL